MHLFLIYQLFDKQFARNLLWSPNPLLCLGYIYYDLSLAQFTVKFSIAAVLILINSVACCYTNADVRGIELIIGASIPEGLCQTLVLACVSAVAALSLHSCVSSLNVCLSCLLHSLVDAACNLCAYLCLLLYLWLCCWLCSLIKAHPTMLVVVKIEY